MFLCFTVCQVEVVSWGMSDNGLHSEYIAINGNRVQNLGFYIGVNLVQLDPRSCSYSNVRFYNTHNLTTDSDNMATYINGLPLNTVLIGFTADDAQNALTQNASNALLAIGVNVTRLQYRGKVSFVAQIGQPATTVSQMAPPGGENLKILVNVTGN